MKECQERFIKEMLQRSFGGFKRKNRENNGTHTQRKITST